MPRPVCTIAGAGEGLGLSLAVKFAVEGFDIALISRNENNSLPIIEAVTASANNSVVRHFVADATKPRSIESAIAQISTDMGETEVLIYNARGEFKSTPPLEMTYQAMEENYQIEVIGAFAATKSVMPSMIKRGRGSIFFSSATAAFRGSGNYPLYAIGKFGLRGLSQSLAKAHAKDGIHIVHFRLDCDLDVPVMKALYGENYNPEKLAKPDDVALNYWLTHIQPKGAWSNEVEIRPHTENWTY